MPGGRHARPRQDYVGPRRRVAGRGGVSSLYGESRSLRIDPTYSRSRPPEETIPWNLSRLSVAIFRERGIREAEGSRPFPRQSRRLPGEQRPQGSAHGLELYRKEK